MGQLVFLIISLGVCCFSVAVAVRKATPCNLQVPLLNYNTDADISATSFMQYHYYNYYYNYTPSEARMSGEGWCADSICTVGSERQYLQVDFGAEVVVEAISIERGRYYHYVTEYYVEYGSNESQVHCAISEDSNTNIFNGVDVCRRDQGVNVKNFTNPIIAQFIRVVPLEWNNMNPCLRLELYGCLAKGCSQIGAVSKNNSLLPVENIFPSNENITTERCFSSLANVNLAFAEPIYLLYTSFYINRSLYEGFSFSLIIYNSSVGDHEYVTYTDMDGIYKFQLTSDDENDEVLLWTPINTAQIILEIRNNMYDSIHRCIAVTFYGCTSDEVINYATDEVSPAITTSCAVTPAQQQTSVITVTTTVSATAVVTPQSSCSCPDQQQTSASSSSSDSDVVTIVIPVVVVLGVIIVIVLIVIGVLIWRKTKHRSDTPSYNTAVPKTKVLVENDLYGMDSSLSNSMANKNNSLDTSAEGNRNYEYPTVAARPSLPTATYDTVAMSLHEEDASET